MIIVFIVALIGLFIAGVMISDGDVDSFGFATSIVSVIAFVACLIAVLVLSVQVSNLKVIDQKIEMYQEENAKIEEQISETVKQYQEYESGIFTEVAPESAVTLVALYPDLKADTLVQKQIEVYLENNEKIKGLKEEKISGSVKRWWLYFGGAKGGERE